MGLQSNKVNGFQIFNGTMNLRGPGNQHRNFKTIVEIHQDKVRNTCFRFVRHPQDADDIAQEVFIRVYESMQHFREESQLSTWIYRIAVNKSLDFIRKKQRKKRLAQLTSIFGIGENENEVNPADHSNPMKELEKSERHDILNRALDELPENQKVAITLSKCEGFSNKEIAAIMDLSLSAVESLIHRAKHSLRKKLYDYFEKKQE